MTAQNSFLSNFKSFFSFYFQKGLKKVGFGFLFKFDIQCGDVLDVTGALFGMRRRRFELDWFYRERMFKAIRTPPKTRF